VSAIEIPKVGPIEQAALLLQRRTEILAIVIAVRELLRVVVEVEVGGHSAPSHSPSRSKTKDSIPAAPPETSPRHWQKLYTKALAQAKPPRQQASRTSISRCRRDQVAKRVSPQASSAEDKISVRITARIVMPFGSK
jgi:hypothetical protein